MAFYMIIEIEVKDHNLYSEYVQKVYDIVIKHGGRYITRDGVITPVSKNWTPERIIIIEFQNKGQIQECFQSPEYRNIAWLRENSTISKAIIVEGHNETSGTSAIT